MRKITVQTGRHNVRRTRALATTGLLSLGLALGLAGCGGGGDATADRAAPAAAPQAAADHDRCGVTVDITGWQAFTALADRITAGEPVTPEEMRALADQPAFGVWIASLAPNEPNPYQIASWVEATFWSELGRTGTGKNDGDRRAISGSWRWAWARRARVDSVAAAYAAPGRACGIVDALNGFVPRDSVPDPLRLFIVPGKPEIRWTDRRVVVDAGVLIAGSLDQLNRQIAGLVYRNVRAEEGPSPLAVDGADAIYQAFRVIRNEAIGNWIEDLPHTMFTPEHPRLKRVTPIPENYFHTTLRVVDICATLLPALLEDPEAMQARGQDFARTIAASGGLAQGGYAMAALIDGRLGHERLVAASRSVVTFLEAYQEAALANGDERPLVGALGHQSWEALAPLPPAVYDGLLELLRKQAPAP